MVFGTEAIAMGSKSSTEEGKVAPSISNQQVAKDTGAGEKKKKSYIIIKGPEFKGRQTFQQVDILKIAIDEIIKTGRFELIFTKPESWREAKVDFLELIMEGQAVQWGKKRDGFNLQFYLVNGKSGKIVLSAEKKWIPDQRLLFTTRSMLYELFYGKELAQKKIEELAQKEKAEEPKIEEEKKDSALPATPASSEPTETALPPEVNPSESKELKKKPPKPKPVVEYQFKRPSKLPPLAAEEENSVDKPTESRTTPGLAANSEDGGSGNRASTPPDPILPTPSNSELNPQEEKKSPEELSEEINQAMQAVIARAKKQRRDGAGEDAEIKDRDAKDKDADKRGAEQAALELTAEQPPPAGSKGGEGNKSIKSYYLKALGMVQEIQSQDIVSTTNNFKFVGVNLQALLQFDQKSKDNLAIDAFLSMAIDTPPEFDVPGVTKLGVRYQKVFGNFFFRPIVGLEYETQAFVNLAQAGSGLQVFSNKILWYYFGAELNFNFFSRNIYLGGYLAKSFVGSTDYGVDKKSKAMDGAKTHYYFGTETAFDFSLEVHYQVSEMSSQGVNRLINTETSSYASLVYKF